MRVVAELVERRKPYIDKGIIPLGLSINGELIYKIVPRISDSLLISAMPGRGKSVLFRLIYWFVSQVRPIIVFDWEGEDHKLSYYSNSKPENLPPGMFPSSIHNAVFFVYGSGGEHYEKKIKPDITDYDIDELEAIGFSTAAALDLKKIFRNYKLKDMYDLIDFVRKFPCNNWEADRLLKKLERGEMPHKAFKNYTEGDSVGLMVKQGMIKQLENLANKDVFRLDHDEDYNIINLLEQGKNVFFNFCGDVGLARVEIMKKMGQIIGYRKKYPNSVAPAVFFEEADALFPKNPSDRERPLVMRGTYYLLRGRKYSLAQYYCCPSFDNLNPRIVSACNEKILGQMEGRDINSLMELTRDDYLYYQVKGLAYNRYSGDREFIYINEFRKAFVFKPFECPQEIHREA